MKRIVTAVVTVIEALAIVLTGLAIIAVPALLLWLVSYGLSGDPAFVFGLIVDLWFFGHGVPLTVTLDATAALALGLPAETVKAVFSLFPLGFMLVTAGLSARTGWRLAAHPPTVAAWGAGAGGAMFFLLSWLLSSWAMRPPLAFGVFGSALMPVLVSVVGLGAGYLVKSFREDALWLDRIRERVERLITETWRWVTDSALLGLRVGGFALTALVAFSTLVFALRLTFNYVDVVSLSQQLQVDVLGSFALFLVNLAYLPTMLIWTMSWMIGPGFAIGTGSSVSALSTQLGPIPSIPILGMLPTGSNPWALAIVNLVLLSGIIATVGVLRRHQADGGSRPTLKQGAVVAVSAAVSAGLGVVVLMWLATGSLGPGRLETVGPHPWVVGGFAALELLIGTVLGLWLTYVDWDRVTVVAREKTQGLRDALPHEAIGSATQRFKRKPKGGAYGSDTGAAGGASGFDPMTGAAGESTQHADENETVELPNFEPWWGDDKDDKI